ncbi:MAG: ShlB/FhaC/HecB family hemolysin secretion/activation protein [Saccharospirillaceae bacterium]|nr:hypothetical protein [Pseudomonadales bacterium]NRB81231.1 ShlB/FhaC/HecB family hemolysin secretion/activation protein [Saccharospirillaceae bacterium]
MLSALFNLKNIPSRLIVQSILILSISVLSNYSFAETQFKYEAAKMLVEGFLIEGYADQSVLQSDIHKSAIDSIIKLDMLNNSIGYDIDSLRELTDQITNYYRAQGFFLASSYIPQQTANDGYIIIKIVEGKLAAVLPQANKVFKKELLQSRFSQYINKAVSKQEIETAVLLVNDIAGYKGSAIFSPGEKVGETLLILQTDEEAKSVSTIGLDNYGSKATGKHRLRGDFAFNNLTGTGDQLVLKTIYAYNYFYTSEDKEKNTKFHFFKFDDPADSINISVIYSRPIINNRINLVSDYSFNKYQVGSGFDDLNINGNSHVLNSVFQLKKLRSENKNINYHAGLSYKYSESFGSDEDIFANSFVLNFGANIFGNSSILNSKYYAQATISQGLLDNLTNSKESNFDEVFTKIKASASVSFPIPKHPNQYILMKSNLQLSPNTLHSTERMVLGGNQAVKGVPISEYAVDNGLIINLEWIAASKQSNELGWLKNIQLSGFIDNAYGSIDVKGVTNKTALTDTGNSTFQSTIGVGINLNPSKGFQVKSTLSYRPTTIETKNYSDFQFLTNLTYQF